ncbi:MAG: hypothetical protein LUQ22_09265 [Methanotrichaceae archaeon]|nr:hypothetical protein [Methanotrichaceae archaeon]
MKVKIIFLFMVTVLVLAGCSKKAVEVKEWNQFQDQIFKVSFSYPKDWVVVPEQTKVSVSSSAEAAEKFFDRDSRKADGVQVVIASERSDSLQDYVKYVRDFKAVKESEGYKVTEIEDAKINGLDAKKIIFSGVIDEKTKIKTIYMATLKDSTIYYVQYAAFNDLYEPYIPVFDSVLSSLILPQKIVRQKGVDPAIPLAQVEKYSDNYIQLEYPANFGPNEMPKKGDMISGVRFAGNMDGMRNDCSIDIDIRPAKNLALAKVVDQNSKFFNPKSNGETTVSGEKAVYLNYTPPKVRNIDSRVYFIVKNNKIYRIILNYYAPMKKDFLPPFEKVVASIRLK